MNEELEGVEPEVIDTPETEQETPQEELSTRDIALSAWDELESNEEDSSEDKPSEEEQPGDDPESDDVVAAADGEDQPGAEPLSAPEHWSAEDKELFTNSTEEVQQWIVARDKGLQADYTTKSQELAEQRKGDEPLYSLAEQTRATFAAQGVTPAQGMAQLVQAQQALLNGTPEQRQAALVQIGQSYGISLTSGTQDPLEDEYQDPELGKLKQQISELTSHVVRTQQDAATQQHQQDYQTVASFGAEQDEAGGLKHPHFEAVRVTMGKLWTQGVDLEELYNTAIFANPETRKAVLDAQATTAKATEDKERVERVDKAKKAAPSNTRSKSVASKANKPLTTKDAASEAWDELASA